jgi:hypothetical protein
MTGRFAFLGILMAVSICLSAPAFAERVNLACTSEQGSTFYILFDTDSRTVTDSENKVYPIRISDTNVTWQYAVGKAPLQIPAYADYERNTAQLHLWANRTALPGGAVMGGFNNISKCVRGQKPF